MADYIEREALEHHFMTTKRYLTKDMVMDAAYEINKFPAADVAPVVHGKWSKMTTTGTDMFGEPTEVIIACNCSVCGLDGMEETDFCPHCGAIMNWRD